MARVPWMLRRFSWALLLNLALVARDHWRALPDSDRRRIGELVRKSRGRPTGLTAAERRELLGLMRRVDFIGLGRDVLPFAGRRRRR